MPDERTAFTEGHANMPPLSEAQKGARRFLINELAQANPDKRTVLLLRGLPGVGKSMVIDTLPKASHIRVPSTDATQILRDQDLHKQWLSPPGVTVIGITPSEETDFKNRYRKTHKIKEYVMKGMTEKEMEAFLATDEQIQYSVPLEKLVALTMGIPRLAQLVTTTTLSEDLLLETVGRYYNSLKDMLPDGDAEQYLHILPSREIQNAADNIQGSSALDLTRVVEKQLRFKELKERYGKERYEVEKVPPESVDPHTNGIYEQAQKNGFNNGNPDIRILAPRIPSASYQQIETSLGLHPENFDRQRWGLWGIVAAIAASPRARIFSSHTGKVDVTIDPPSGERIQSGYEDSKISELAATIPQLATGPSDETQARVFLRVEDHQGYPDGIRQVITFGYMIESLFQRLGIPYVVTNKLAEENYWYDPSIQKLRILPSNTDS